MTDVVANIITYQIGLEGAELPAANSYTDQQITARQALFPSRAAAAATRISPLLVSFATLGYASPGDGGGCDCYIRSSGMPSYPGGFQDATGAWWAFAGSEANVRTFGALGNGVQNPTTGAWSGTLDTLAFKNTEAAATVLGIPRVVPRGNFLVDDQITGTAQQGMQNTSNVLWYGLGDQSLVVDLNVGAHGNSRVWGYAGVADSNTSTTCYLIAPANAGDLTIQINNTSLVAVEMWLSLNDHSQPIINHNGGAKVCNLGQYAKIKAIINATTIQLYGMIEASLTANSGNPISATTIRRFTAPITNVVFRDFQVVNDKTLSYTGTDKIFEVFQAIGPQFIRVSTNGCFKYERLMQDCITYHVDFGGNVRHYSTTDATSYCVVDRSSAFGVIDNYIGIGGRHAFDFAPDSTDGIESSHNNVNNANAYGFAIAPFQTHPGARHVAFNACQATGGGENTIPGDAAYQPRGRFISLNNCKATGFHVGVYLTDGEDLTIDGGEFNSCDYGIVIGLTYRPTIRGEPIIRNARIAPVQINSTGMPGLSIGRVRVVNPPSGQAVIQNTGSWGSDWTLETPFAPGATTFYSSIPANFQWTNLGIITSGTVTPDAAVNSFFTYQNAGAHTLNPSPNFGKYTLDIVNVSGVGIISVQNWTKISGDALTTTQGDSFSCTCTVGPAGSLLSVQNVTLHQSLITTLDNLGLLVGLELCLDLGDINCYPGTGTTLTDLAGGSPAGFTFGGTVPTFSGVAGNLSAAEYLTFGGHGYLTYAAANEAWMDALHNGTPFSMMAVAYVGVVGATQRLAGTNGHSTSNIGIEWGANTAGASVLAVSNGTGVYGLNIFDSTQASWIVGNWAFYFLSLAPAVPKGGTLGVNVKRKVEVSAITTPSALAATDPLQIMASGGNSAPISAATRMGMFAAWGGLALNFNQFESIFGVIRQRYAI